MSCEVSDKSKNGSSKADHLNTRIPYGIRPVVKVRSYTLIVFQSTHPVWDATIRKVKMLVLREFQSTHPVWDATHAKALTYISPLFQSTHPVWDATLKSSFPTIIVSFQSTHPVWDATDNDGILRCGLDISIHASRMGCDARLYVGQSQSTNFNPRIPYGMRRANVQVRFPSSWYFNPRIPYGMRRASPAAR